MAILMKNELLFAAVESTANSPQAITASNYVRAMDVSFAPEGLTRIDRSGIASGSQGMYKSKYGGSVELFTRMSLATQHLGFDSERLKGVLETVNQTVAISGSSAQAATAGLIQFSQGLASNRLGGEELRSVMEQIPPLGYAIAEGMGVSIAEFRQLSKMAN